MEKDTRYLYYPSFSVLTPPHLVGSGFVEDSREASAEFLSEVPVSNAEKDLVMPFVYVEVSIAEDNANNVG